MNTSESIAKKCVRFASLTLICMYGAVTALITQQAAPNYGRLLGLATCGLVFYFFIITLHLWLGRGKNWKFITFYTIIVVGFFAELAIRVRFH
jgi:hypothetical protein